jgi:hypothetical protein
VISGDADCVTALSTCGEFIGLSGLAPNVAQPLKKIFARVAGLTGAFRLMWVKQARQPAPLYQGEKRMMTATQTQITTKPRYSYQETLVASQKANWRIEDILGGDKRLGFTKPHLPESFARVEELGFLTPAEKLKLNQIRGFDYLCTFGLVEEFILPFVLDHARPHLQGDDYRVRAFLAFAAEEAKHIHLFKQF